MPLLIRLLCWSVGIVLALTSLSLMVGVSDAKRRSENGRRNQSSVVCKDPSLEDREEMANVVLTGTLKKIHSPRNDGTYDADVRIRRVIKGDISSRISVLRVEGFGNKNICRNTAKEKDTRIFMINKSPSGHFILNSSLVKVTLRNLDLVQAACRGKTSPSDGFTFVQSALDHWAAAAIPFLKCHHTLF